MNVPGPHRLRWDHWFHLSDPDSPLSPLLLQLPAGACVFVRLKGVQWAWHCTPSGLNYSPSVTLSSGIIVVSLLPPPRELLDPAPGTGPGDRF